nr:hypothetical protein [Ruficoccus amylovorans]
MIVTFFSSKPYDERYFKEAGKGDRRHEMVFQEARLLTFPNVLITGHQAFFTDNALRQIARTTLDNLHEIERTGECANRVYPDML